MSTTEDLLSYLFDGAPHLLFEPMAGWLESSRRFATFVTAFQDKIRKKLRTTQDQENLLDLRLELETAYLLLQERSLSLAYEPELSRRRRGPDFAVSFTTSTTFMLEVTRVRADPKNTVEARLSHTIASKLGQLLPGRGNVLLVGVEAMGQAPSDVRAVMLNLQQRAERNDPILVQRYGFRDRADFFQHYLRLSEVLVRGPHFDETRSVEAWVNPQARHPLPGKVRSALYKSHTS